MPKKKSNRTAMKKFRVGGTGVVKRKQANTSHNTAKRLRRRMRKLKGHTIIDKTDLKAVEGMLPYMYSK